MTKPPRGARAPYIRLRIDKRDAFSHVTRSDIVAAVLRELASDCLPPGSRLPPVRVLRHQHGISKNTAQAAYEELVARGAVENRKRLGYFVLATDNAQRPTSIPPAASLEMQACSAIPAPAARNLCRGHEPIALSSVFIARDLLPLARIAECFRACLKSSGVPYMYDEQGLEPLRKCIAKRLEKRGIPAQADDIIITAGSQQALDMAFRALQKRAIAAENPTYLIGKQLLQMQGLQITSLPLDPFVGIDVQDWRRRLAARRPAALYLTTNFHNPTGYSYSTTELTAVLALSRELQFGLIEDDWGSDMLSHSEFRPPLRALGGDRVLYVNSFTKKLLPSLRIGYVLGNAAIRDALLAAKRVTTLGNPAIMETVLFEFIDRGYYDTHLRALQRELNSRYHACLESLRTLMPQGVRWTTPGGGPILWLEIPRAINLLKLAERLRERRVLLNSGASNCFFGTPHLHGVVIGYAHCASKRLSEGLEILAEELKRGLR